MKKFPLLLVFTIFWITASSQNWSKLNSGTTKDINDIYFQSPDTGYIVGENYLFKKTVDGGDTWFDLTPPTIGEWPSNNGNIVGIDFHLPGQFSNIDSALFLVWEKGYHGVYTSDDGNNYTLYGFTDSSTFCEIRGFSRLATYNLNGYVNLITYGKNCNGIATFANFYDGPFSFAYIDSAFVNDKGSFTSVDVDSFNIIMAHESGNLLRFNGPFSTTSTILLDTSGASAVGYAGDNIWYAATRSGINNMYVSVDSGKSFVIDSTFLQTFHYPIVNDFSFNSKGSGIAAATSNGAFGVIIHKDTSGWSFFQSADYPLRAAKIFDNGTAYAAGDSGLIMKIEGIETLIPEHEVPESKIEVYPNPARKQVSFKTTEKVDALQILNSLGKEVAVYFNLNFKDKIDISELPTGTYLLKFNSGGKEFMKKLLVVND